MRGRSMTYAILFPGQGSQSIGMGKDFYDQFDVAKKVFHTADEVLGAHLRDMIFEGNAEELTLTYNAQPALLTVSTAILRVMEAEFGFDVAQAAFGAGHSLGEYSALMALGTLSFEDAVQLVRTRGYAMQEAVPVGEGAMLAVLGLEKSVVEGIAAKASEEGLCCIANDNAPGQIVLSGAVKGIEAAQVLAKEAGAKRSVRLPVSAPFHSPLMAPAEAVMAAAFEKVAFHAPKTPLIANVSAAPVEAPAVIQEGLVKQISGQVRWTESIEYMAKNGVQQTLEIGAGKVLAGLTKRIASEMTGVSLSTVDAVKAYFEK